MYPDTDLHIAGAWTKGSGSETMPVLNPANGETLGRLAVATRDDLDRALDAARQGFSEWRTVSAFARGKVMRKAAELLREAEGLSTAD